MKIFVLGIPDISIESLATFDNVANLQHLISIGSYGYIETTSPAEIVHFWMTYATSDWHHSDLIEDDKPTICSYLTSLGKKSIVIGIDPEEESLPIVKEHPQPLYVKNTGGIQTCIQNDETNELLTNFCDRHRDQTDNAIQMLRDENWDYFHLVLSNSLSPKLSNCLNKSQNIKQTYYKNVDLQVGKFLGVLPNRLIFLLVFKTEMTTDVDQSSFIIITRNNHQIGEIVGASLIDLAPTLLSLAKFDIPPSMKGVSITLSNINNEGITKSEEDILIERLSGLGYL